MANPSNKPCDSFIDFYHLFIITQNLTLLEKPVLTLQGLQLAIIPYQPLDLATVDYYLIRDMDNFLQFFFPGKQYKIPS